MDQMIETQEVTWEELYENVQDDNPNLGLDRLKEMMERLDPSREELWRMMEREMILRPDFGVPRAYISTQPTVDRAWMAHRMSRTPMEWTREYLGSYSIGVCTPNRQNALTSSTWRELTTLGSDE